MKLSSISLITGVSLCFEYVAAMPEEDIPNSLIIDVIVFRFIFTLGKN